MCDWGVQVCLKWDTEDAADSEVDGFQLLVDGVPVGDPLKKSTRQVTIDELKPGQELDVSLMPLDSSRQPLGSSNVVKACSSINYCSSTDFSDHKHHFLFYFISELYCSMSVLYNVYSTDIL